jgi:hypothetical protein
MPTTAVSINLYDGRNLALRRSGLPPSTFVQISLDGNTKRTKGSSTHSSSPEYNQTLECVG